MKQVTKNTASVEVLAFRRGLQQATIVTDGQHTRSFTVRDCKSHTDLKAAIAYLEAQGYNIITDGSW